MLGLKKLYPVVIGKPKNTLIFNGWGIYNLHSALNTQY